MPMLAMLHTPWNSNIHHSHLKLSSCPHLIPIRMRACVRACVCACRQDQQIRLKRHVLKIYKIFPMYDDVPLNVQHAQPIVFVMSLMHMQFHHGVTRVARGRQSKEHARCR